MCVVGLIPIRPGLEPERRDAARNRELLLRAARGLIEECGADGLTMGTLASPGIALRAACESDMQAVWREIRLNHPTRRDHALHLIRVAPDD